MNVDGPRVSKSELTISKGDGKNVSQGCVLNQHIFANTCDALHLFVVSVVGDKEIL